MRPLHWSKLPDMKVVGTIWVDESAKSGIGMESSDIDVELIESVFGVAAAAPTTPEKSKSGFGKKKEAAPEKVALLDMKRSNNVGIALARLRVTDAVIKAAILDPVSHPLSSEKVDALIGMLPTTEELDSVRDFSGDPSTLGRVEQFFLALSDIPNLSPRLMALQASQQFGPSWEALAHELKTMLSATKQVGDSKALKLVLSRVLAVGNYLNGTSTRGGAYGFKLADLGKLAQVKSADGKSTLLHFLARLLTTDSGSAVDELKGELAALPEAKDMAMEDKNADLAKLEQSFKQAKTQLELSKKAEKPDAITPLLTSFCDDNSARLEQLRTDQKDLVTKLKELAKLLCEKPNATTNELFAPLADFVKALEKAHQENVKAEEAEKKKSKRILPSMRRKSSTNAAGDKHSAPAPAAGKLGADQKQAAAAGLAAAAAMRAGGLRKVPMPP